MTVGVTGRLHRRGLFDSRCLATITRKQATTAAGDACSLLCETSIQLRPIHLDSSDTRRDLTTGGITPPLCQVGSINVSSSNARRGYPPLFFGIEVIKRATQTTSIDCELVIHMKSCTHTTRSVRLSCFSPSGSRPSICSNSVRHTPSCSTLPDLRWCQIQCTARNSRMRAICGFVSHCVFCCCLVLLQIVCCFLLGQ